MPHRNTGLEEKALSSAYKKKKEDTAAVFHCSTRPWLMVSVPGVNGSYLCECVMHYLRVNTVETERPSGGGYY